MRIRAIVIVFMLVSTLTVKGQDAGTEAPSSDYILQRGDTIQVRAYNLSDLDTELRIRPDGMVSLMLLNEVSAAGLTPSQLSKNLSQAYTAHFKNARLTVVVKEFASQRVFVGGEVGAPGAVDLPGDMTALQAVIKAGGLKNPASAKEVFVIRDMDKGTPRVEAVNVREVLEEGKSDVVLRPSDMIYVPDSTLTVYVGGEVVRPGLIPLSGDLTIMAAVFQAGGFRATAKTDSVVLVRDSGEEGRPLIKPVRLDDVFLDAPHTKLQPFDLVYVPKSRIAKMDQWVDQYLRQLSPMIFSFGFSYLFGQRDQTQSAVPIIF